MTNIAIVVLDTLRKDTFDDYFEWLPGKKFENAWSTSHYTVPAHASLFTGFYPSEVGVHAKGEQFNTSQKVLAERLTEAGYTTRAINGNILLSISGFDRGFDHFYNIDQATVTNEDVFSWYDLGGDDLRNPIFKYMSYMWRFLTSDSSIVKSSKYIYNKKINGFHGAKEALEAIRTMKFGEQEFLFINLMEAHSCHNDPDYIGETEEHTTCREIYNNSVEELSIIYNKIFSELKNEFDYIITLSDHGELFGEYGLCRHWHGVWPELVHVPICISSEEIPSEYSDVTVNTLDVHQTVLNLADIEGESRGQDLRDVSESNSPCLTEYHGIRDGQKEALRRQDVSEERIANFDKPLRGVALDDGYAYETPNGFIDDSSQNAQEVLNKVIDDIDFTKATGHSKPSKDIKKHLEDLGYA